MIDCRFRSLEKWPASPPLRRLKSQFSMKHGKVIDLLEHELKHLKGRDIVIEAGFAPQDIRNDGWPRGGAVPKYHPGVILYFDGRDGKMRMPCGTYAGWQSNLQAIARTLELLRTIDRYGVTMGHEQYQGFKALPAADINGFATLEDAAAFISIQAGGYSDTKTIIEQVGVRQTAYREAASRLHPDRPDTGNPHLWALLQKAIGLFKQSKEQEPA